jgi:protein TonB
MSAVRLPAALLLGLLFTLVVFTVLSRFVDEPARPPDLRAIVDVFSSPLRPTPPPPPPARPTKVRPPTLIPEPGRGTGVRIVEPPPHEPPPRVEQPGQVRVVTERGGGLPTSGIDREPIPFVRLDPEYPPRARAAGTEGWVQVQFTITAAGTVKDARVVAAEPRGVFEDAALKSIARWRYSPKVESGAPVERVGLQTVIRFRLER